MLRKLDVLQKTAEEITQSTGNKVCIPTLCMFDVALKMYTHDRAPGHNIVIIDLSTKDNFQGLYIVSL